MRIPLACVLVWGLPFTAQAGLNFEATSLDVKAESGAAQLTIEVPVQEHGRQEGHDFRGGERLRMHDRRVGQEGL